MKRHIFAGWFVLCLVGCFEEEAAPDGPLVDAGTHPDDANPDRRVEINVITGREIPFADPLVRHDGGPDAGPPWPRSHPVGTLLVDHLGELWMVVEDGVRYQVSGDDTLGYISLDEHDATVMTPEEERCLTASSDYWGPANGGWWPVYGPTEDDPGPFILDGISHTRRPVSFEALESWGYYWRWMDYFDGGDDEWLSYAFDPEPIPLRDGTLVHTEYGFYYVVHGRSFFFSPSELVAQAGYHPEGALWMSDRRLREIAPVSIAFTHETFERCPADER